MFHTHHHDVQKSRLPLQDEQFDTRAAKVSVRETMPINTAGYDNPITTDDVGHNSDEQPPSYASMHDDKTYVALVPPSSVNIVHNNIA